MYASVENAFVSKWVDMGASITYAKSQISEPGSSIGSYYFVETATPNKQYIFQVDLSTGSYKINMHTMGFADSPVNVNIVGYGAMGMYEGAFFAGNYQSYADATTWTTSTAYTRAGFVSGIEGINSNHQYSGTEAV